MDTELKLRTMLSAASMSSWPTSRPRAEIVERGVAVGPVTDPDGNTFALQKIAWRTGASL
jgi:hypothetical protein